MPLPVEVDQLEKKIVTIEEAIRNCHKEIIRGENNAASAKMFMETAKNVKMNCEKILFGMKKEQVVDLVEYRSTMKDFHDSSDVFQKHQLNHQKFLKDVNTFKTNIPILEANLKKAKAELAEWGIVIQFPTR